jgi:tetratricopeptide (TPR) repeat protein
LLRQRSTFFARCRRWQEALADLDKVIQLEATDDDSAFQSAVLLLETGDNENYRAHCQKMVTNFRAANAPRPWAKTAEACLLAPGAGSDYYKDAVQLADQAFTLGKNGYRLHDLEFIKGLAEYRLGQFESAIDWVRKSIGQPTMVTGPRPDAPAYLILAMAQHQLKRPDEARAALAKGADIVNTKLLKLENATLDENWLDWLIAHILLREAQALIGGPPPTK